MSDVNLSSIGETAKTGIAGAEATLTSAISNIKSGTSMGIGDMVDLQYKMSAYTVSANTFSALIKEVSDTMKSVVQKTS
jgi:hypothetical protein